MKSGVNVTFSPSAEVREGQRVRLSCNTHCPLTDNKNYIWYRNHELLQEPQHRNKHLVLDPVTRQHAGGYSCSASTHTHIRAAEETLVVQISSVRWIQAAAVGVGVAALLFITLILTCCIR